MILFLSDIYPEVELLDQKVVLLLFFNSYLIFREVCAFIGQAGFLKRLKLEKWVPLVPEQLMLHRLVGH